MIKTCSPFAVVFLSSTLFHKKGPYFCQKCLKLICAAVCADKRLRSDVRQEVHQFGCEAAQIGRGALRAPRPMCVVAQINVKPVCRMLNLHFLSVQTAAQLKSDPFLAKSATLSAK